MYEWKLVTGALINYKYIICHAFMLPVIEILILIREAYILVLIDVAKPNWLFAQDEYLLSFRVALL